MVSALSVSHSTTHFREPLHICSCTGTSQYIQGSTLARLAASVVVGLPHQRQRNTGPPAVLQQHLCQGSIDALLLTASCSLSGCTG